MSIKISNRGLDALIRDLRAFQTEGVQRAQRALDDALGATYQHQYAQAHVHTGGMKEASYCTTEHEVNGWTGEIVWPGRAALAEVELRGKDHDFTRGSDALAPLFERALDRAFDAIR